MLGRLLNTAASTLNPAAYSSRNTTQLESVTEEEHTSGLLFPDASLLRRSNTHAYPLQSAFNSPNASSAGAYDDRGGGIELDAAKDFRVIVAQNALGDRDACVLMDSRGAATEQSSLGLPLGVDAQSSGYAGPRHGRTVSNLSRGPRRVATSHSTGEPSAFSLAADARRSPPGNTGAFSRARGRSSTLSQGGGSGGDGLHDSGPARGSADSTDSGLLNCIFGSSAFSYRGSSTKMHLISADEEPGRTASASPASRGPISRAFTIGTPSNFIGPNRAGDEKPPAKVTVLLTRMFSVSLSEGGGDPSSDQSDSAVSMYPESSYSETAFPFPDVTKRTKIRERKTPMYAVAITIQIPLLGRNAGRPVSRFSSQGTESPRMGMSCSLDSDYRSRGGFLDDSLSLASPPASLDERIDLLVDHWDVVTRTLSHLERVAREEILLLLKKVDANTRISPNPAKHPNMQRTNQTVIHLPPNAMAVNSKLRMESARSARRISAALQMPYVVTGQSRWGVWREEGRSIVRALGDKEHSFFFLVLITAFLGNHTEWLNALGPEWYRRRHHLHQKAQQDTDPVISNRTVIVSGDKMTARRLIFLLSAFLPAKQRFEPLPSPLRPGTSTSIRNISQSPPTSSVPVLRQESLRRAIERRSRAQRMNRSDNNDQHHRSVSVSSNETTHRSTDDADTVPVPPPPELPQYRRGSDARSVRTLGVAMNTQDPRTKNTSTATISTTTPSSTVPVPHFAARQRRPEREGLDRTAAESSDSLASENLLKNLQRSESSGYNPNSSLPSTGGGRWGGLFSGLWTSRHGSAPYNQDRSPEARRRSVSGYPNLPKRGSQTLSQYMQETSTVPEESPDHTTSGHISIRQPSAAAAYGVGDESQELSSADQAKESPLKMSVRGDDGVVDVDLPLPGFLSLSSSGDSTVASPKKTRTSVTSVDAMGSTHSSGSGFPCQPKDVEGPNINVAGWLKSFHDDFLLQAVRPYSGLEAEIKRAMQSEPTPCASFSPDVDGSERWVDVATTLIADTRTFTVKRLRLRRKAPLESELGTPGSPISVRRPSIAQSVSTTGPHSTTHLPQTSATPAAGGGLATNEVEERFVEEPVMDLDGTLIDALDRVLAQSGQSSIAQSRAPSPPRSRKPDSRRLSECAREDFPSVEVPRTECRNTVLGALEEVVRSVTAEHCRDDMDGELGLADRERRRSLAGVDNTLREGVRRWLLDVEEAW